MSLIEERDLLAEYRAAGGASASLFKTKLEDDSFERQLAVSLFRSSTDQLNLADTSIKQPHGTAPQALFYTTNTMDLYLSDSQKKEFLGGLPDKFKNFWSMTPAEKQSLAIENTQLKERVLGVGVLIAAAESSAVASKNVYDQLISTRLGETREGIDEAKKAAYIFGINLMAGSDRGTSEAAKIGYNINGVTKDVFENSLKPWGKEGAIAKIGENPSANIAGVMGQIKGDIYLVAPNYDVQAQKFDNDNPIVFDTTQSDLLKPFSGFWTVLNRGANTTLTGQLLDGIDTAINSTVMSKIFDERNIIDPRLRAQLREEASAMGQFGKGTHTIGTVLGVAANIFELILIAKLMAVAVPTTGGVGAVVLAPTAWMKIKNIASGFMALSRQQKLVMSSIAATKAGLQMYNQSGVGYGERYSLTENSDKYAAQLAFDFTTMYASMGLSERFVTSMSSGLVSNAAKAFAAREAGRFYSQLNNYVFLHNVGDTVIDLGIDLVAHNSVEAAFGIDSVFTIDQERRLSFIGEEQASTEGIITQLAYRLGSRVGSNQMSRLTGWATGTKADRLGGSNWLKTMDAQFNADAKSKLGSKLNRRLYQFNSYLFNDSMNNINAIVKNSSLEGSDAAMWKFLSSQQDPRASYLALYKYQELMANDAYRGLSTLYSKTAGLFRQGTDPITSATSKLEAMFSIYNRDLGYGMESALASKLVDGANIMLSSDDDIDKLTKRLSGYIIGGVAGMNSATPTDTIDSVDNITTRHKEVQSLLRDFVKPSEDSDFVEVSTKVYNSLNKQIGSIVGEALGQIEERGGGIAPVPQSKITIEMATTLSNFSKYFQSDASEDQSFSASPTNLLKGLLGYDDIFSLTKFKADKDTVEEIKKMIDKTETDSISRRKAISDLVETDLKNIETKLNDPSIRETERARLEAARDDLLNYKEYKAYNSDPANYASGIDQVVAFLKSLNPSKGTTLTDQLNGNSITGEFLVDAIAAATALSNVQIKALEDFIGSDSSVRANRIAAMTHEQFIVFYNTRILPLASLSVFYENMGDSDRLKYSQLFSDISSGYKRIKKTVKSVDEIERIVSRLSAMDKITLSRRALGAALAADARLQRVHELAATLGVDDLISRLSLAFAGQYANLNGFSITDTDNNDYFRARMDNVSDMSSTNDSTPIESRHLAFKQALAFITGRKIAHTIVNEGLVQGSMPTHDSVKTITNNFLKSMFGDSVRVESFSHDGVTPTVKLDFSKLIDTTSKDMDIYQGLFLTALNRTEPDNGAALRSLLTDLPTSDYIKNKVTDAYESYVDVRSELIKTNPTAMRAIYSKTLSTFATTGTINYEEIKKMLYDANLGHLLWKYGTDQDIIIKNMIKETLISEDSVTKFTESTKTFSIENKPVRVLTNDYFSMLFVDDNITESGKDIILREGYLLMSTYGAALKPMYIKLNPILKSLESGDNYMKFLDSLIATYTKEYDRYSHLGTKDDFVSNALEGLTEEKRLLEGISGAKFSVNDRLASLIKVFGNAYKNSIGVNDISAPDTTTKISGLNLTMAEVTDKVNSFDDNYLRSIAQPVNEIISLIRRVKSLRDGLTGLTTNDSASENIKKLIEDAKNVASQFTSLKLDNGDIEQRLTSLLALGEPIGNISKAIAEFESNMQALADRVDAQTDVLSMQQSLLKFKRGELRGVNLAVFVYGILKHDKSVNPNSQMGNVTIANATFVAKQIEQASVYRDISDAVVNDKKVNDMIKVLSTGDQEKLVSNIVGITLTRGLGFSADAGEVAKRMGALLSGSTMDIDTARKTAQLMFSGKGIAKPEDEVLEVHIKNLHPGANFAEPEFLKYLALAHGNPTENQGKYAVDFGGGGLGKVFYGETNNVRGKKDPKHVAIEIGSENLKTLFKGDISFLKTKDNNDVILIKGRDNIAKFLLGHRLHSLTFSNLKSSTTGSQLNITPLGDVLTSRNTYNTNLGAVRTNATNITDHINQASRSINRQNETTIIATNAQAKASYGTDDIHRFQMPSPLTHERASLGTLEPDISGNISILMLARLANNVLVENNDTSTATGKAIKDAIAKVLESHDKLENLSKNDLADSSNTLLSYLSKGDTTYIVSDGAGNNTSYYIGLSRSPQPSETAGLVRISGVLNTRFSSTIQLSGEAQKIVGGDFDGDVTLGIGKISKETYIKALSKVIHGDVSSSSIKAIKDNFNSSVNYLYSREIRRQDIQRPFMSPPTGVKPVSAFSPESLDKGTQAISTMMKQMEIFTVIYNQINRNGAYGMSHDTLTKAVEMVTEKYKSNTLIGDKITFKDILTGVAPASSRFPSVVLLENNDTALFDGTLFPGQAVGSFAAIGINKLRSTGENGEERYAIVIRSDVAGDKSPTATVVVVEEDTKHLGVVKILGFDSKSYDIQQALSSAETYVHMRGNIITDRLVKFSNESYLAMPDTMFDALNAALVSPKPHMQEVIQKRYGDNVGKFTQDYSNYVAEIYAASINPLSFYYDGTTYTHVSKAVYDNPSLGSDSPIRQKLHIQDVQSTVSRGIVESIAYSIKADASYLSDAVAMRNVNNSIPLARQQEVMGYIKNIRPGDIIGLPVEIQELRSLESGFDIKDMPNLANVSGEGYLDEALKLSTPIYNVDKIRLWKDIEGVAVALRNIKDMTNSSMSVTTLTELSIALKSEGIYSVDAKYRNRSLVDIVYDRLNNSSVPLSKGNISYVLEDVLGVKFADNARSVTLDDISKSSYLEIGLNAVNGRSSFNEELRRYLVDTRTGKEVTADMLSNRLFDILKKRSHKGGDRLFSVEFELVRTVLDPMIGILSEPSKIRALAAAEGISYDTVSSIKELISNGVVESTADTGRYKLNVSGLVKPIAGADDTLPIEKRVGVQQSMNRLLTFRRNKLLFNDNSVRTSVTSGEGGC